MKANKVKHDQQVEQAKWSAVSIGSKIAPRNHTTPWQLGSQWLTGIGPRSQQFHDQDPFTILLRQHDHMQEVLQKLRKRYSYGEFELGIALDDDFDYRLGGLDGVGKYVNDYGTLLDGGATGNIAVTYLGSYSVTVVPLAKSGSRTVTTVFQVRNFSTLASATHLPLYGIIPGYEEWENFENSLVPSGPMSKTTQEITWTEDVSW